MKKCIMVGYEEEKLLALRMYAEQRGVSVEEELAQAAESMYQKVVPANVRVYPGNRGKGTGLGRMLPFLPSGIDCEQRRKGQQKESHSSEVSGLLLRQCL